MRPSEQLNSSGNDFEIDEKELDENYNMSQANTVKNYYLKQSQYLSGITEQSLEESLFSQSLDRNSLKADDNSKQIAQLASNEVDTKELLISKYSCSEDGINPDSMAFLYDKLQDQLQDPASNTRPADAGVGVGVDLNDNSSR